MIHAHEVAARPSDELDAAARLLARRVAAIPSRDRTLFWQNHSSLSDAKSQELLESFSAEFGGEKPRTAPEESLATVRVSLRETPTRILFVAAVAGPDGQEVRITEAPRASASSASPVADAPQLQKELLWRQDAPIADAVQLAAGPPKTNYLVLLAPESVRAYRAQPSGAGVDAWKLLDSASLPVSANGRAFRGELRPDAVHPGEFKVILSGKTCDAAIAEKIQLSCQAAAEPWRDGVLLGSRCDRAVWRLKADSGDRTMPDRLLLRNPSAAKSAASISELELPGPVLSLASGEDFHWSTAVVLNLSTGSYEVYRITLACRN